MSNRLHIDFETRSEANLKLTGTVPYAADRSTHVLVAWILWKGKWYLFDPTRNRKQIRQLMEKAHESKATIVAYNWTFEYCIMRYVCTRLYNWPYFNTNRFECSMARSLRFGLPGSLNADSTYLGTAPKDAEGHRLMLRLTKPRAPLKAEKDAGKGHYLLYDQSPEKFQAVADYCFDDVAAETDLESVVPALSKRETKIFKLDQQSNNNGVHVDLKLCRGAIKINKAYEKHLLGSLPSSAWRAFDTIGQREKVRAYCLREDKGLHLPNMQGPTIAEALRTCTNKKARRVLTAFSQVGGQASNKYAAVLRMQHRGLLRFQLQYCGASSTGRWSGRGVQLQNLSRPVIDYDTEAVKAIRSGNYNRAVEYCKHGAAILGKPVETTVADLLKSYIRCFIIPAPGGHFAVNDYSSVEARKVFWYAGDKVGLEVFASGDDPYIWMARQIFGIPPDIKVTEEQRFVGKQSILGMGYGMGAKRFAEQCSDYGQHISIGLSFKALNTYRNRFRKVVKFWYDCEDAVKELLEHRILDKWLEVGKVYYRYDGINVICLLPSGTELLYHRIRLEGDSLVYWSTPMQGPRVMVERRIWGGTFVENICQASSRDLMADAMLRLDLHEFPNIIQIHDELINHIGHPDCMQEVQACIKTLPKWAPKFPLEIKGQVLDRYRKI